MVIRRRLARGQAMVELLIVGGFVLVPLFLAIPLLAKYMDVRNAAVQASRYAAWERTVWFGGDAASEAQLLGWTSSTKWKANEKNDSAIRQDIAVRQLARAGDGFITGGGNHQGTNLFWQDRTSTVLANYNDVQNSIAARDAPGTMNAVLDPIVSVASLLGPFVLEMKGNYKATVNISARDIDTSHFLFKPNTTVGFQESNVLLANGWSANGANDTSKTSVRQQVKGLTPLSLLNVEVGGFNITKLILSIASILAPELSKFEPGKIEPDVIPADRKK